MRSEQAVRATKANSSLLLLSAARRVALVTLVVVLVWLLTAWALL